MVRGGVWVKEAAAWGAGRAAATGVAATEVAVRAVVVKAEAGMAGVAVVVTVEGAMEVAATEEVRAVAARAAEREAAA